MKIKSCRNCLSAESRDEGPKMIKYLLLFFLGMIPGSLYAVRAGTSSLLFRILQSQLSLLPEISLSMLVRERGLLVLLTLLCIYVAGRSQIGRFLLPPVLFLFGLTEGIVITFLLLKMGGHAIPFLLLAVILPKTLSLLILLFLCRLSLLRSEALNGQNRGGEEGTGLTFLLLSVLYLLVFLLEQILLLHSVHLIL